MPVIERSVEIRAPREALFDLAQDYYVRTEWDPFLREMRFLGGARAAAPGVRVMVRARNGLSMEVEYVTVVRPDQLPYALEVAAPRSRPGDLLGVRPDVPRPSPPPAPPRGSPPAQRVMKISLTREQPWARQAHIAGNMRLAATRTAPGAFARNAPAPPGPR